MSSQELRRLITRYFGQYIVKDIVKVSKENVATLTKNKSTLHIREYCKNKNPKQSANEQSEVRHK